MNDDTGDGVTKVVWLQDVPRTSTPDDADQASRIFKEAMSTKTIRQENVCLLIDGYHYYQNVKRIRKKAFSELYRTASIPLSWKRTDVRLNQIPKLFLELHDLDGPSQSQLRDISFVLIDEALRAMCDRLQQRRSRIDSVHYSTIEEIWEKSRQVARGEAQMPVIDQMTHVIEFNREVYVGYAMLDAHFYRCELERRRADARNEKEKPCDLNQIRSIREAMDALDNNLQIITKPKPDRAHTSEEHQTPFAMPLGEYYEFIQSIPQYRARERMPAGHYRFTIDEYGLNDLAEFEEKQVDVSLTIAAAEKIFDSENVWSIGIVTGDADYVPVFRKSAGNRRNAFLLVFGNAPYAYKNAGFDVDIIGLGREISSYIRELEITRVIRLANFISACRSYVSDQPFYAFLEQGISQGYLDDAKTSELRHQHEEVIRQHVEYIQRHIQNCERLYGAKVVEGELSG